MNDLTISAAEFELFRQLMHRLAGVDLQASKKHLVSGRLARRVRERGVRSFADYYRVITSSTEGDELDRVVDLLTTHETYFFREPAHFDYLAREIVPHARHGAEFRVWSAASSTGEEAYSIAMVLMDTLGENSKWEVFGSDISSEVVDKARTGVYAMNRIDGIPKEYLHRFCLRGTGAREGTLKVGSILQRHVRFEQVNLNGEVAEHGLFDVIFLRNVLIYFDKDTKRSIAERLTHQLKPGGRLIVGHSESLNGVTALLLPERPTIYRRS